MPSPGFAKPEDAMALECSDSSPGKKSSLRNLLNRLSFHPSSGDAGGHSGRFTGSKGVKPAVPKGQGVLRGLWTRQEQEQAIQDEHIPSQVKPLFSERVVIVLCVGWGERGGGGFTFSARKFSRLWRDLSACLSWKHAL